MSMQPASATTNRHVYGWRASTARVIANALLVLLAFEAVLMAWVAATIVAGGDVHVAPVGLAFPLVAVFHLVRWAAVLPGLVPVLAGIEYVARRVPHPRVVTVIVESAPMVLWETSKSPGRFPSEFGLILGVTAVLFAVIARLPGRLGR